MIMPSSTFRLSPRVKNQNQILRGKTFTGVLARFTFLGLHATILTQLERRILSSAKAFILTSLSQECLLLRFAAPIKKKDFALQQENALSSDGASSASVCASHALLSSFLSNSFKLRRGKRALD